MDDLERRSRGDLYVYLPVIDKFKLDWLALPFFSKSSISPASQGLVYRGIFLCVKRSGSLVLQYLTKIYPYVIYPLRDHDKHYGFLPVNIQVYFWY